MGGPSSDTQIVILGRAGGESRGPPWALAPFPTLCLSGEGSSGRREAPPEDDGSGGAPHCVYSATIGIRAFCAARHTACGVAGMAMSSWPRASVSALITAAGEAMAPASPQPLIPSGFEGQGVVVIPTSKDGRSTARG